jgi:hypothetical protein
MPTKVRGPPLTLLGCSRLIIAEPTFSGLSFMVLRDMDAVTLYAIVTLANGEMKTHVARMRSTVQCEQQIARLPRDRILDWCRGHSVLVGSGHTLCREHML